MFKDIYKAANDDIKPDPYLLGRILNKSKEKQKPFLYRHRVVVFAAALALVIALPSIINSPGITGSDVLEQSLLPEAKNDSTYFILSGKTSDATEKASDSTGHITEYDYTHVETAPGSQKKTLSEMTVVMSINSFSSTPQTASLARSMDGEIGQIDEVTEIIAGQYFEDLGFSPDTLDVPENLFPAFDGDTTVTITKKDGEVLSDENTFTFTGENFLMLTTSSNRENALAYINNDHFEKSVFGDKNAVIFYDGSVYESHIIHSSGTALKFVTDISEEQLKNLLISAAK